MDMQLGGNRRREKSYRGVQGTIVSIEPTRIGNRRADGCLMFVGLENQDGDLVNFMVSPTTFVLDFVMLREGMDVTMYYRTDEPVPLIYPPQYRAAVAVPTSPPPTISALWETPLTMIWWWCTAAPPGAYRPRLRLQGSWCCAL